MTTTREHLQVRVNEELVLDAGTTEKTPGPDGPELLIRPPASTLFHQVLGYLRSKPNPSARPSGSMAGREGMAAAALTLRWGSFLTVLLDQEKPVWPEAHSTGTSRVNDDEMARINIEASAALADWINLFRAEYDSYLQLVERAMCYLPMPKKRPKLKVTEFGALADPDVAERIIQSADPARVERARGISESHTTRVFSNALVNTAWRNGPIEDIHAGKFRGYPLDQRRITPAEEQGIMVFANERLALGMAVCLQLAIEQPRRPWSEQILPYGLAEMMMITPSRWSLTEASREVRLPV
jgi:hypothetical protein